MKATAYLRVPAKSGEASISVRYTHRHQYFAVKTGLTVKPAQFDVADGSLRRSHPDCNLMNALLDKQKASIMHAARSLLLQGIDPTVEAVRAVMQGKPVAIAPRATPIFAPVLVETQPVLSAPAAIRKAKKVKTGPNRFLELLHKYGLGAVHDAASTKKDKKLFVKVITELQAWHGEELHLEKMDNDFYKRLATYFLNVRGGYNNVFGKRIKELKTFLRWCELECEVPVNAGYRKWKVYHEEKEIVFLTPEEVERLRTATALPSHLEKYRDLFVFSCLTGFRWSDIVRSKQMVVQNGLLTITTQKNRGSAKVPVNDRIMEILERYDGNLNIVTLQKLNAGIKEVAKRLGLDEEVQYYRHRLKEAVGFKAAKYELLSVHCGRRTFITNAFAKGFSVPEILEMIGSTDAKVLHGYMAITSSHLIEKTRQLTA